jgi:hypothetical protein
MWCVAISVGVLLVLQHEQNVEWTWRREKRSVRSPATSPDEDTAAKVTDYVNTTLNKHDKDWPPLKSLIGDRDSDIRADVQFLLDFAIVAHPKTATTFTMNWLASHEEIQMHQTELHDLQMGKPAAMVSTMYALPAGRQYKRGYKAPNDLTNHHALQAFQKYWPKTKLMVGLRHPVLWFESFYNFRLRHNFTLPPPEQLIGGCPIQVWGVCTDGSRFHLHLDNLGKTPRSDLMEKKLLQSHTGPWMPRLKNEVFLYELGQLMDTNLTRAAVYRADLKDFLGLRNPLEPIAQGSSEKSKEKAMNICEKRYQALRKELMKNAMEASMWIRVYLLQSPDVYVSSPEHFNELLETWMKDPCEDRA